MRQVDKDDTPGLGEVIKRPEEVKPYRYIGRGVWQRPDGKFETQITPPETPTIWELYGMTKGAKP